MENSPATTLVQFRFLLLMKHSQTRKKGIVKFIPISKNIRITCYSNYKKIDLKSVTISLTIF